MNFVYQCKVIILSFYKTSSAVKNGDYVILRADENNEFDSDAISVFNSDGQQVGNIANSSKTLSVNNIANGNLSATQLKGELDFTNKEYYAEAIRVYSSCIYLEVNEGKWSYINPIEDVSEFVFVKAIDLEEDVAEANTETEQQTDVESLKAEVEHLKIIVQDLQNVVVDLKSIARMGGK